MTVRELLRRIDSRELSEWMAYAQLEPFGSQWEDLRVGHLCACMVQLWSTGQQSLTASDLAPRPIADAPKTPEQTGREIMEELKALTIRMGGTVHSG